MSDSKSETEKTTAKKQVDRRENLLRKLGSLEAKAMTLKAVIAAIYITVGVLSSTLVVFSVYVLLNEPESLEEWRWRLNACYAAVVFILSSLAWTYAASRHHNTLNCYITDIEQFIASSENDSE